MSEYKYDINECSVTDKAQLAKFREKRKEWFTWIELDEHHSIRAQIHSLMWNDAFFRSMNEARRFGSTENPTAAVNGSLCEFIDIGYVSAQILSICKLTDGRNDVISLRRLSDDIREHQNLLTREHFVSYDGLPYDFEAAHQECGEATWISTTGPEAWGMSQAAHLAFDKLSCVAATDRKRTDLIRPSVFESIDAWFDAPVLDKLQIRRHKFVAHAADRSSREAKPLDRLGLSLNEIEEAQRTIVRIATAIGSHILHGSSLGSVVPTPQFDVFDKLDMAVIPADKMGAMTEWWHRHEAERERWLGDGFDVSSK